MHSNCKLHDLAKIWRIKCRSLVKDYVTDVITAILLSYQGDEGIISVPNHETQNIMSNVLKITNHKLYDSIFYLDGTHKLCLGRNDANKRSWKHHWKAAWSHLFVIERIFGIIIAANVGNPSKKHDLKILRESNFGINFKNLLSELHNCLGDSAYVNFVEKSFAPMPKKSSIIYSLLDRKFRYEHKAVRVEIEHFFGNFFINQFYRLNFWTIKCKASLQILNCCLICSIIFWNQCKIWKMIEKVNQTCK